MNNSRNVVEPPVVAQIPEVIRMHGEEWVDNYFWLRNRGDKKVLKYIEEENCYTDEIMKGTEQFQRRLFDEMVSRINETDMSVPEKIRDFYYYSTTEKGKQYPCYCRKPAAESVSSVSQDPGIGSEEEVILDLNKLAEGKAFLRVGIMKISPDQKLLAYSVDYTGDEVYTIFFKDLESGKIFADEIPNTSYGAEWSSDSKVLFYTTLDDSQRSCRLYRHVLHTDVATDELVYFEENNEFLIHIAKTRSKKFFRLVITSHVSNEEHILEADDPMGEFRLLFKRKPMVEYEISHHEDHLYVITNENAVNFRLFRIPLNHLDMAHAEEMQAHDEEVAIEGVDSFRNYIVLYERENGLPKIKIIEPATWTHRYIEMNEPAYECWTEGNSDYDTTTLRYVFTSLVTPRTVKDFNFETGEVTLMKQYEVLGGYRPEDYVTERRYAESHDGRKIPLSIVYRKSSKIGPDTPLLLYGYGSYGINNDPSFSSTRLSLLDRGFVYAIAHIRGSSYLGRKWYEDGKFLNKMNTFRDFISSAEYLIRENFTSSEKLVIYGGSAGGLLMGAVSNMRPDLFKAVVAVVPFVDVLNSMSDPTLPLTVMEYNEWGNPADREYFEYMKKYSPYDNVKAQNYPHMLVISGINDCRVQYWEPLKWVARLRAEKTDDHLLLLKMNMNEGHGGASGRYDHLKDDAFEYAFIFKVLGIRMEN